MTNGQLACLLRLQLDSCLAGAQPLRRLLRPHSYVARRARNDPVVAKQRVIGP